MKKHAKRFLSLLLVAIMVVSVIPVGTTQVSAATTSARQAAVDYMRQMATVKWTATRDFKAYGNNGVFKKGVTYTGIPYSQYNNTVWATLESFEKYKNGSLSDSYGRNDCSAAVYYAWRHIGYRGCSWAFNTTNMIDGYNNGKYGIKKVSNYDSLQPGDALVSSGHAILVVGVNKANKTVSVIEQCGGKWLVTNLKSSWWIHNRTYSELKASNYRGITCDALGGTIIVDPSAPIPNTPNTPTVSATNIAVGKSVTVSWNSVVNAAKYSLEISGAENRTIKNITGSSTTITLANAGTYNFKVKSINKDGKDNGKWSNTASVVSHNPVTVKFLDHDGSDVGYNGGVKVRYGESAVAPVSPAREGYTFDGWDGSYYNVTKDVTITAKYKINVYNVNFLDQNGDLIGETQKIKYGEDATPPTNINVENGYKFVKWSSEAYKNVGKDKTVLTGTGNKTININAICEWANPDIPIVATITTAERKDDGYYVYFDLENKLDTIQHGRVIICVKTAEGKLIETTESRAFSIPANSSKTGMEEFIESSSAASVVELIVVDNFFSGVPLSEKVTSDITNGLAWSEWSVTNNAPQNAQVESRTEYRYRDKETNTYNLKTLEGWIWDGTKKEVYQSETGFQDTQVQTYDNESGKCVLVDTQNVNVKGWKTQYCYYHYYNPTGGNGGAHYWCPTHHYKESDSNEAGKWTYHRFFTFDPNAVSDWGYSTCWTNKKKFRYYDCPSCSSSSANQYWFLNSGYPKSVETVVGTKTQYNYATYKYEYGFYRWKDWSSWSPNSATASNSKQVETRTTYRYKCVLNTTEDTSGKFYETTGSLGTEFANKQITLYVYKFDGSSDYTNVYIGQGETNANGNYSFEYKLRQEPTAKTGDFTVAIGVEGTTNTIVVGKIEAPKPKYTVNFYGADGTIISTQTVIEGEDAVLPANQVKEGHDFCGWDKSAKDIKEDVDIYPVFEKQTFVIVYVDWSSQQIEVKKFAYGDILTTPDYASVEGYTFKGWDAIIGGDTIVTKDMVISAQYDINEYTVNFCDYEGNVVDSQTVKYGYSAELPDNLPEGENGEQFAGWFNPEEYEYVDSDINILPMYYFEETAETPVANYTSGEYGDKISLELTTSDENAVIFYYLNNDITTEKIYTEPVVIDKTCSVTYYATCLGKNNSQELTEYYCINSSDKPSEWMLYSQLPTEVKENIGEYNLESEDGYRYKDVKKTSVLTEIDKLENNGWTCASTTYSDYSSWQDEVIEKDTSLLGFEIDTQVVDDTSVTRYQYSHYKYTDENGDVLYSPTTVSGYECEYETITLDSRLSIAGFTENDVSYYNHDGEQWFTQTKVCGEKTQYRSRYKIAEYYKWTAWGIDAPSSNETRAYENDTVYRYSNMNYHIVTLVDGFGDSNRIYLIKDGAKFDVSCIETYGYTVENLYCDGDFSEVFDLNTQIKESVTLYANYEPISYSVIFQMKDGTELDTQTVDYLESATAPETDVVPGYVFAGWDKEFDCITEDTVITGKYVKEEEYARVSLSNSVLSLFVNNSYNLYSYVTPEALTNEIVEWSTSDASVASVDENGVVTALSAGTATITATVLSSKETAECEVTVVDDLTKNLCLISTSPLNYDSLGYLRRIPVKTTATDVLAEFANKNTVICDINGNTLLADDFVGTGARIMLMNGTNVLDSKTIVITGDMTGEGFINNRDVAMMNKYLVQKASPAETQIAAIDVNGDGYVNNRDAAMVARYLVGKDTF